MVTVPVGAVGWFVMSLTVTTQAAGIGTLALRHFSLVDVQSFAPPAAECAKGAPGPWSAADADWEHSLKSTPDTFPFVTVSSCDGGDHPSPSGVTT